MSSLVEVKKLSKQFSMSKSLFTGSSKTVKALRSVSIQIKKGETFCLVGESGCGKTTLGRTIIGLLEPTIGEVWFDNERVDNLSNRSRNRFRQRMQMIFQNPYASLNPRMTVQQTLEEPIKFHRPELSKNEIKEFVEQVMVSVGNDPSWGARYPHEFSGGQRQRISIARALMVEPEFIVADEPVSALDVSIQAQVLNVLMKARDERQLTYLFISHDLSVVEHIGDRVAVMYLGTICEIAKTEDLFSTPLHPYTQLLLSAIPKIDKQFNYDYKASEGSNAQTESGGCVFEGRCPLAFDRCKAEVPQLREVGGGRYVACHAVG